MVNFKEDERLTTLNHSCAHVMAQAVKHLYPHAKFWVGPVVKEGFYYDIDLGNDVVNDEVIAAIEKEMKKICKEGKKIYRREVSKAEAMEMFKDDMYKLDLISNLEDGNITVYDQGDFTDLCRGPHVDNTKLCKNFKLVKHSGVYWKGDASNHVMQRIYGVCRTYDNTNAAERISDSQISEMLSWGSPLLFFLAAADTTQDNRLLVDNAILDARLHQTYPALLIHLDADVARIQQLLLSSRKNL